MTRHKEDIIVGLDIGTTKIACIIGEVTPDGVDIIGIGSHVSTGLRKGAVIHIDATVNSIKKAVEEAELMAGVEVRTVYAGIAGNHIQGHNSHGIVAVKDKEVRHSDIARVVDAASAMAMPMDRQILHVIPQEYVIDAQDGIHEPLGMSGVRLEAKVHIVSASVTSAQNIMKCCKQCGLDVEEIVLEQLASSDAVLSDDEKELGVAIVDIGGGTTDIAIFSQGALVHTAVLAIGGNHITNDIAVGLRTPMNEAERIKHAYGCCLATQVNPEDTIEVPSVGGRPPRIISRQLLAEIIEPRVEEIFAYVYREIIEAGCEDLIASGVVITGGSTMMDNMDVLAEEVLGIPVRNGRPKGVGGLVDVVRHPRFATGVGLVHYGMKQADKEDLLAMRVDEGFYSKMTSRMKQWFTEFF